METCLGYVSSVVKSTPHRDMWRSEVFTVWTNYPNEAHTECLIQECADAGLKELSLFGKLKTCCNLPDLCLIKLKPYCVALLRRGKVTRIFPRLFSQRRHSWLQE